MNRRNFLTLTELLVALSLLAGLISLLLVYFRHIQVMPKDIEEELWPVRKAYALNQRLERVLDEIVPPQGGLKSTLFSEQIHGKDSLVFVFNNGLDEKPWMNGDVMGRLYVDSQHRLVLALWPNPARWNLHPIPSHQELLFDEKVTDLKFEFFEPPRFEERPVKEGHPTAIPELWSSEWKITYPELPALVRMTLIYVSKGRTETLCFTFPIIQSGKPVRFLLQGDDP